MTEAAAARREVEAAGIGHAQPVSPAEPGATLTESSPDLELCSILVYERGLIELEQAAHRC